MSQRTTPTMDRRGLIGVVLAAIALISELFMPAAGGMVGQLLVLTLAVLGIVQAVRAKSTSLRFIAAGLATLTIFLGVVVLLFSH